MKYLTQKYHTVGTTLIFNRKTEETDRIDTPNIFMIAHFPGLAHDINRKCLLSTHTAIIRFTYISKQVPVQLLWKFQSLRLKLLYH